MRQDIEKILDDVASCYSDYASPNEKTVPEATEAILELIKGAVPNTKPVNYAEEGWEDGEIHEWTDDQAKGYNACRQAMLDKLGIKEK